MALVKSHIQWAEKISAYPVQSNTLTYTGASLSPTWNYFDTNKMEIVGGTESAINAGTYFRNFKPLRKYVFPNGTKTIYAAEWKIGKAAGSVTLSETSGEVKIKFTKKFTVTKIGDGVISVKSSNDSIATATISSATVTITGKSVGNATITVSVAEGTNYLATSTTYAIKSSRAQRHIP